MEQDPYVINNVEIQNAMIVLALKTSQPKMRDNRWISVWNDRGARETQ